MLMLTFISVFVFPVISAATEDDVCDQEGYPSCYNFDGEVFPDSVETLNKNCPILISNFKCLVDFINKCPDHEMSSYLEKINVFYNLTIEACNKESKLHHELSIILPCTEEVVMSHRSTCKPMVKEAMEEITSGLSLERDEDGYLTKDEDIYKYHCSYTAIDTSCFVARTSLRCGEKTGEFVGGILDRIGFAYNHCPANIREEVQAAVAVVKIAMEQKLAIEEITSKV